MASRLSVLRAWWPVIKQVLRDLAKPRLWPHMWRGMRESWKLRAQEKREAEREAEIKRRTGMSSIEIEKEDAHNKLKGKW